MHFFVGTQTGSGSKGIYSVKLDNESGEMSAPLLAAEAIHPTFLAMHPDGRHLYAVNELDEPAKQGAVVAYQISGTDLTLLNAERSGGGGACHVSVMPDGRAALVANYGSTVVALLPIEKDGKLRPAVTAEHHGGGPNQARQQSPHPHSFSPDLSGTFGFAVDLGTDSVVVYQIAADGHSMLRRSVFQCPPGSGPRHLALHRNGKFVFLLTELSSQVLVLKWNELAGELEFVHAIDSLPEDYSGANVGREHAASEIAVHPTLPYVYAANRLHDSIARCKIANDGRLCMIDHTSCGGKFPRHFAIDPDGRFLVVANQHSNSIASFELNPTDGRLTRRHQVELASPMCICFASI